MKYQSFKNNKKEVGISIDIRACMRIPMQAIASSEFQSRPEKTTMSSYHHHSKQTETQLGIPWQRMGFHSLKHCVDQPGQDRLQAPEAAR